MAAYISFQPRDHYKTITYAGTGSGAKVVTGVGFQPDFTWFKQYDATRSWVQIDSVQGVSKAVSSDGDAAQQSNANYLASFDSDGFTTGATQDNGTNTSGGNYVSYSWKAGTTSGLATNGSTTITPSSYSFNQTTGISIITYAGNGTSGAKLAHGLGQVPAVFFVKFLYPNSCPGFEISIPIEFLFNNLYFFHCESPACQAAYKSGTIKIISPFLLIK